MLKIRVVALSIFFFLSIAAKKNAKISNFKEVIENFTSCNNFYDVITTFDDARPHYFTWHTGREELSFGSELDEETLVVTFEFNPPLTFLDQDKKTVEIRDFFLAIVYTGEIESISLQPDYRSSGDIRRKYVEQVLGKPMDSFNLVPGGDPESGDPLPYEYCLDKNGSQIVYIYKINNKFVEIDFWYETGSDNQPIKSIFISLKKFEYKTCEELQKELNNQMKKQEPNSN